MSADRTDRGERPVEIIIYQKACDCEDATASGPRYIAAAQEMVGVFQVQVQAHRLVCDECDTPWREATTDDD